MNGLPVQNEGLDAEGLPQPQHVNPGKKPEDLTRRRLLCRIAPLIGQVLHPRR
jgi:hypothetical protein